MTILYKWILPVLFLYAVSHLSFLIMSIRDTAGRPISILALGYPALALLVMTYAYIFTIWPLADAVFDAGDRLIVRRHRSEFSIEIAQVSNVKYSGGRMPTVHLSLGEARIRKISFLVDDTGSWGFFGIGAKHPLAEDLRSRAEAARLRS